jgi:bifunctional DNA-binding transcriptional regulator/antitoxin component of YhaV-PrlF toxin-antitoxin module
MMVAALPFKRHSGWMKTAMDAAGRVVIPKALRLALGFKPGQVLEARAAEGDWKSRLPPRQ